MKPTHDSTQVLDASDFPRLLALAEAHGFDPHDLDTSVSDGTFGSLFQPWAETLLGSIHARIAEIYGVGRAFVSTNGTTAANKLALYTLVSPGDDVLVQRDSHISILQALNEIGARPVWLVPPYDPNLGINLAPTPSQVGELLDRYPQIRAAVFTSPSYFGVIGDLAEYVARCRERGVRVFVDEAHGDCLPFHADRPTSATDAAVAADIVTLSTHKATEAMSQGSLLLIKDSADEWLARRFLHALNGTPTISTSFNYAIIASVAEAILALAEEGDKRLVAARFFAEQLREGVRAIPGLRTWGGEQANRDGFRRFNPLRVTVDVTDWGISGFAVEALLQKAHPALKPVVAEFGSLRHVIFLVSYGNTDEDVAVALAHLREIGAAVREGSTLARNYDGDRRHHDIPQNIADVGAMLPRDAFWAVADGRTERVLVEQAVGQIAGECIAVYPPGSAIIVHGERVTSEAVEYLREVVGLGAHLKGATDPYFETMLIIK